MEQRWVFQKLVKKPTDGSLDLIGYIAYALYKAKKDELATNLRESNTPEDIIDRRLKEFHDNTLLTPRECDSLRENAEQILNSGIDAALSSLEETLNNDMTIAIDKVKNDFARKESQLQKERTEFEKKRQSTRTALRKEESRKLLAAAKEAVLPTKRERVIDWVLNGFSGIVATFILGVIVFGGAAMFSSQETKQQLLENVVRWAANTSTSNPFPDVSTEPTITNQAGKPSQTPSKPTQ
ncbi:hypothetical protein DC915_RS03285 [Vibrio parahaemolyticus]|uniref:Uncharacterized protein n=2 Tax=Vibrio harveyi group TaxID=717610 RepID=A0A9Q3U7T4_VIBPH|nr:hypothetical protein [Vibrio parahaemolyticus]CAH1592703.1 conserved hypothetical protein [Vibrio jasicida]EJC7176268.1 hypothetical protein [Vibrio parahaemolyticus]EJE4724717.1 hypothetical protein [Vibrio parahaemolyticus]EJG0010003.1 hypothetical protein [Vibrio parahaemolyticus]MCC3803904.1 hypothetical protein [Vibrio parahaemolyticus]